MPKAKTLLTRVVLGAAMIAVLAGVLVLDHRDVLASKLADIHGLLLTLAVVVLGVAAFRELRRLARAAGTDLLPIGGIVGMILVGTFPTWRQGVPVGILLEDVWLLLGVVVLGVFAEQIARRRVEGALVRIGATLLAVLYLGVGSALMLTLRLDRGVPVLVLFLAAVKGTDIGAYLTGILIGRHKLIPWLSPGKTWEGLLGGLAFGAAAAVGTVWLLDIPDLSLGSAAIFGAVVGLAGQFADLCESLLKRSARVKDSGALLPAFGGVLDVLDSPLLAAPVAYLLLTVLPQTY